MTIRIIKEKDVKSFNDYLKKYCFQEIPHTYFKMLAKQYRPLRKYKEIKLYGYRIDGMKGVRTVYFFEAGRKAYWATLSAGSTKFLMEDIKELRDAQIFCVTP